MKECIDEANLEAFVPSRADRYFFTKDFISHVEKLKSKRVSKEEYLSCQYSHPPNELFRFPI